MWEFSHPVAHLPETPLLAVFAPQPVKRGNFVEEWSHVHSATLGYAHNKLEFFHFMLTNDERYPDALWETRSVLSREMKIFKNRNSRVSLRAVNQEFVPIVGSQRQICRFTRGLELVLCHLACIGQTNIFVVLY